MSILVNCKRLKTISIILLFMLMMAILPDGISAGESIKNIDLPPDVKSLFESSIDSSQIPDKAVFWTAVTRGFAVSENALGDMNQDGIINIWDLLRVRNIYLGVGDPPTGYESVEGDMNQDMVIDAQDVFEFRDVLIRAIGLPHLIGEEGGTISGDRMRIDIPSSNNPISSLINVRRVSGSELLDSFKLDIELETLEENYFFGAFEIKSDSNFDFAKQFQYDIIPDSIPPCQFQGENILLEIIDDMDGDGINELIHHSYMYPSTDSTSLISDSTSALLITEILSNENQIWSSSSKSQSASPFEPGEELFIYGDNFPASVTEIIFKFTSSSGTSLFIPATYTIRDTTLEEEPIIGVGTIIPYLGEVGQTELKVYDQVLGYVSPPIMIEILPLNAGPSFPLDTLSHIELLLDSLFSRINQCSTIQETFLPLGEMLTTELPNLEIQISEFFDSVALIEDQELLGQIAGIFCNFDMVGKTESLLTTLDETFCNPSRSPSSTEIGNAVIGVGIVCGVAAVGVAVVAGGMVVAGVAGAGSAFLSGSLATAGSFAYTGGALVGIGSAIKSGSLEPLGNLIPGYGAIKGGFGALKGNNPTGGIGPGGKKSANGCCINVFNYGQNVGGPSSCGCGSGMRNQLSPYLNNTNLSAEGFSGFDQNNSRMDIDDEIIPATTWISPLSGAIVSSTNVKAAYGVVGYIDNAGDWLIPNLPLNTNVTLSVYDPKTGLYDPEAASFVTLDQPGGNGLILIHFNPDISIVKFPISINEYLTDEIGNGRPIIEFTLYNSEYDIGRKVNIGFQAENELTLWFRNPYDTFLVKDSLSDCAFEFQYELVDTGLYKLRVTYGADGDSGKFIIGISDSETPPTPYLCGEILYDTLYEVYSPYKFGSYSYLSTGDTLIIEPGVDLQFKEGGRIQSFGSARGLTTPTNPIILTPTAWDSVKTGGYYSFGADGVNLRKEVNR